MRIVVNDVAATPGAGGVYSILSDFYVDVLKHDHKNKWFFILAGKYFSENDNVKIIKREDLKKSKVKKLSFELFYGKKFINKLKPDVYISLQNIATYGVKAKKKIVYLHQALPFEKIKKFSFFKKNERKLAFYQRCVGFLIKKSIHDIQPEVIVQTKWMKDEVIKQCNLNSKHIIIKYPRIIVNKCSKYHGQGNRFFYPASSYLYKNHQLIFKACNLLTKKGIKNFKVDLTLKEIQLPYRSKNINYIGHISRKKVMEKYTKEVLIFPSYIESFGLPLIEAASTSDIVLAANTTFSKELLGNYSNSYFFAINDEIELAKLMEKVINHKIVSNNQTLDFYTGSESLLEFIKKLYL